MEISIETVVAGFNFERSKIVEVMTEPCQGGLSTRSLHDEVWDTHVPRPSPFFPKEKA